MTTTFKASLAAATLAAAFAIPAAAADLGGWGRGSIKDDYAAPAAPVSPCYYRADVGYSFSNKPDLRWAAVPGPGMMANERVTKTHMDDSWTGGVGAGCSSGSRGFRYEFMLGYHGDRSLGGTTSPYWNGAAAVMNPIKSSVTTYTGMVNGYFDLGNFRGVVPYVGVGVGLAYNQMDDYSLPIAGAVPYRVKGDNDLTLAWSVMAGFAYQVSERAILDLGYRYIDFGRAATSRTDNFSFTPAALSVDSMNAHEIKVGLRYHMGGNCCEARQVPLK